MFMYKYFYVILCTTAVCTRVHWVLPIKFAISHVKRCIFTSCSNWPFQRQKWSHDDFCRKIITATSVYMKKGKKLNLTFERQIRYVACIFRVSFAILIRWIKQILDYSDCIESSIWISNKKKNKLNVIFCK